MKVRAILGDDLFGLHGTAFLPKYNSRRRAQEFVNSKMLSVAWGGLTD